MLWLYQSNDPFAIFRIAEGLKSNNLKAVTITCRQLAITSIAEKKTDTPVLPDGLKEILLVKISCCLQFDHRPIYQHNIRPLVLNRPHRVANGGKDFHFKPADSASFKPFNLS